MRLFILICFAIVTNHLLEAAATHWSGTQHISFYGTNCFDFKVTTDLLAKAPKWKNKDSNPPLAARKAIRAAVRMLSTLVPDSREWKVDTLSLEPLHDEYWYYLVNFSSPRPPSGERAWTVSIPVLMNGVAIKPKVQPEWMYRTH